MPRLSNRFVGDITVPQSGQTIYRDDDLTGFGLRVTKGSMSWIVETKTAGKTRRITICRTSELSAEQARKEAKRLLGEMSTGTIIPNRRSLPKTTLREVLEHYLANRRLRPNTIALCRGVINRCIPDWLDKPITSITAQMVEERHRQLPHETMFGTSGEAQANTCMVTLNRLFNYAINHYESEDGKPLFTVNPVQKLVNKRAWYPERRRRNTIPDHKLADWWQALLKLDQPLYRDYLLFLLLTGLRRNEAAQLRWQNVDFDGKTLTVPSAITKNKRDHTLPLSDLVEELLRRRRNMVGNCDLVFPRTRNNGKPVISSHRLNAKIVKASSIEFTLHDLRRSFISMAAKIGVNYLLIKRLANHTGREDITSGYIFFHPEQLREPMQAITDRFVALMQLDLEALPKDSCPPFPLAGRGSTSGRAENRKRET